VQQAALLQGARVQREVPEVSQKQWGFDVLEAHELEAQCQTGAAAAKAANRAKVNVMGIRRRAT
jgi:hypothetical protein